MTYPRSGPSVINGHETMQGTTITRYVTELAPEQPKLIAVSASYITYGLQKGHIRVLHRRTGKRALLKDHESLLSDLRSVPPFIVTSQLSLGSCWPAVKEHFLPCRFCNEATDHLASACSGGKVVVRRLFLEGEEVQAQTLISLQLLQNTSASLFNKPNERSTLNYGMT